MNPALLLPVLYTLFKQVSSSFTENTRQIPCLLADYMAGIGEETLAAQAYTIYLMYEPVGTILIHILFTYLFISSAGQVTVSVVGREATV